VHKYLRTPPPGAQRTSLQLRLIRTDRAARCTAQLVHRTVNPLRITVGGLRLTGYCAGRLRVWVRLNTGTWMGECTFTVHSGNHRAALKLRQWWPAAAGSWWGPSAPGTVLETFTVRSWPSASVRGDHLRVGQDR
jgi:hypothetical protein